MAPVKRFQNLDTVNPFYNLSSALWRETRVVYMTDAENVGTFSEAGKEKEPFGEAL